MEWIARHWWWLLIGLLAVTGLLYALPLQGAEFAWDDGALVVDNALTGSLASWREMLQADLWRTTRLPAPHSGYYRPLFLLHLALDRALFGLSVDAHHLISLGWHLLCVGLLALLLRRLVGDMPALLGAAFFALHPVQSETVALIAARNDSMAAALLLVALLALLPERVAPWRLAAAALATAAALMSKESAVLAPAFLLALDLARWRRPRGWMRYGALLLGVAAYAGLRLWSGVGSAALPDPSELSTVAPRSLHIGAVYASLISWPWPLTPARHVDWLPPLSGLLLGGMLTIAAYGLGVFFARKRALVLAGLALALLAFLPTLAATFDKGLLGERYLYLPMAGLALAFAAAVPLRRATLLWSLPVLLAWGGVLQLRLPDWQDSATLWRAADRSAPSPFTKGGLAWYLRRDGDPEGALELVIEAIEGEPPYTDACPFLGMIPLELGRAEQAAQLAGWGLSERGCPPSLELVGSYAVGLAGAGEWEMAMAVAQRPELKGPTTGQVVLAAGMVLQGNQVPMQRFAEGWPGGRDDFIRRVVKLLRLAGHEVHALQTPPGEGGAP
jgi:tetratricopeptide (TPR) repeat protein